MADPIDDLNTWFNKLARRDQEKVLESLYGKALLRKGLYVGPRPEWGQRGLFLGPAPVASSNVCTACGRPF